MHQIKKLILIALVALLPLALATRSVTRTYHNVVVNRVSPSSLNRVQPLYGRPTNFNRDYYDFQPAPLPLHPNPLDLFPFHNFPLVQPFFRHSYYRRPNYGPLQPVQPSYAPPPSSVASTGAESAAPPSTDLNSQPEVPPSGGSYGRPASSRPAGSPASLGRPSFSPVRQPNTISTHPSRVRPAAPFIAPSVSNNYPTVSSTQAPTLSSTANDADIGFDEPTSNSSSSSLAGPVVSGSNRSSPTSGPLVGTLNGNVSTSS